MIKNNVEDEEKNQIDDSEKVGKDISRNELKTRWM